MYRPESLQSCLEHTVRESASRRAKDENAHLRLNQLTSDISSSRDSLKTHVSISRLSASKLNKLYENTKDWSEDNRSLLAANVTAIREVLASNETRLQNVRKALIQACNTRQEHEEVATLTETTPELVQELTQLRALVDQDRSQLETAFVKFNDLRKHTAEAENEHRNLNTSYHDIKTQLEHRKNCAAAIETEYQLQTETFAQLTAELNACIEAITTTNAQLAESLETDKTLKLEWVKLRGQTGLEVIREAKTVPQAIEIRRTQLNEAHSTGADKARAAEQVLKQAESDVAQVEQDLSDMKLRVQGLHDTIEKHRGQTQLHIQEIAIRDHEMQRVAGLRHQVDQLQVLRLQQDGCARETRKIAKDAMGELHDLRTKLGQVRKMFESAREGFMSKSDAILKETMKANSTRNTILDKLTDITTKTQQLEQQREQKSKSLSEIGTEKERIAYSSNAELEEIRRSDQSVTEETQQVEEALRSLTLKLHEVMQAKSAAERALKQQGGVGADPEAHHSKQRNKLEQSHNQVMSRLNEQTSKLKQATQALTPGDIEQLPKEQLLKYLENLDNALSAGLN